MLRNALRELSESYADQPDAPFGPVRLMGSAGVAPVANAAVDLTFTAFLAGATSAAARAAPPSFPRSIPATSTLFHPT